MNTLLSYMRDNKHIALVVLLCLCACAMLVSAAFIGPAPQEAVIPDESSTVDNNDKQANREGEEIGSSGSTDIRADKEFVKDFNGYGLYIDGSFICAARSSASINNALQTLIDRKVELLGLESVSEKRLINNVETKAGHYADNVFAEQDEITAMLGIENAYSATFILKNIYGEAVDTNLSVLAVAQQTVEEKVAFGVVNQYTDSERDGYSKVISAGEEGVREAVYDCIYLDDELMQTCLNTEKIISEPTDEIRLVGTRVSGTQVASLTGFLDYPYVGGQISSGFGYRDFDGNHKGIDIVALEGGCYGDDVLAAADGVVVEAGYRSGGYGIMVRLRHSEELVTLYCHLSEVVVSEGDVVTQGQKIGEVGSTGRSTGPHLHFEVQINDEAVDPELFLEY